jgi:hypothetical protein
MGRVGVLACGLALFAAGFSLAGCSHSGTKSEPAPSRVSSPISALPSLGHVTTGPYAGPTATIVFTRDNRTLSAGESRLFLADRINPGNRITCVSHDAEVSVIVPKPGRRGAGGASDWGFGPASLSLSTNHDGSVSADCK